MVAMINEQYIARSRQFQVAGKCRDGESALRFLDRERVDLIIMDVYMPQMDGLRTLHAIRERKLPVSVIMVTAANDVSTLEEALSLGAVDYLVKPFAADRFHMALQKFIAQTAALKDVSVLNQDSIDSIIAGAQARPAVPEQTPKGIQPKTLAVIEEALAAAGGAWLTGDAIAESTGLSSVTTRRYMNHLVRTGVAQGELDYETGGRPCMRYRLIDK